MIFFVTLQSFLRYERQAAFVQAGNSKMADRSFKLLDFFPRQVQPTVFVVLHIYGQYNLFIGNNRGINEKCFQ